MIGFVFVGLTAITLIALLFPLLRHGGTAGHARASYEIAVYRDQLTELERDIARGMMAQAQAEAARLEIQRRILASADGDISAGVGDNRRVNRIAAIIIALAVSGGSWGLYAYLGSPELPDRPFAVRQNDPDMQLNATADIIAATLEARPDADGYKRLAEMFYALRRFNSAAAAAQKAIDLGSGDAETWSQLGEALVMANDGVVVTEARNVFKKSLTRNKNEPRARFYIGLALAQDGKTKQAFAIWRNLEKTAPPGAPWLPMVKDNIASYAKQGGFDPASVSPAPP